MLMSLRFRPLARSGQSTLEYAILITIIIAALISMQIFIKRGVAGRLRQASSDIGEQYSVGNTNILETTTTTSNTQEKFTNGVSKTSMTAPEKTDISKKSAILNIVEEDMGK